MLHEKAYYYEYMSEFSMECECNRTTDGEYDIKRITKINLPYDGFEIHNESLGIFLFRNPVVEEYEGFSVIRIGDNPRYIRLIDEDACRYMREDLAKNGHLMIYWQEGAIVLITDKKHWVKVCKDFLSNFCNTKYLDNIGLEISID